MSSYLKFKEILQNLLRLKEQNYKRVCEDQYQEMANAIAANKPLNLYQEVDTNYGQDLLENRRIDLDKLNDVKTHIEAQITSIRLLYDFLTKLNSILINKLHSEAILSLSELQKECFGAIANELNAKSSGKYIFSQEDKSPVLDHSAFVDVVQGNVRTLEFYSTNPNNHHFTLPSHYINFQYGISFPNFIFTNFTNICKQLSNFNPEENSDLTTLVQNTSNSLDALLTKLNKELNEVKNYINVISAHNEHIEDLIPKANILLYYTKMNDIKNNCHTEIQNIQILQRVINIFDELRTNPATKESLDRVLDGFNNINFANLAGDVKTDGEKEST